LFETDAQIDNFLKRISIFEGENLYEKLMNSLHASEKTADYYIEMKKAISEKVRLQKQNDFLNSQIVTLTNELKNANSKIDFDIEDTTKDTNRESENLQSEFTNVVPPEDKNTEPMPKQAPEHRKNESKISENEDEDYTQKSFLSVFNVLGAIIIGILIFVFVYNKIPDNTIVKQHVSPLPYYPNIDSLANETLILIQNLVPKE